MKISFCSIAFRSQPTDIDGIVSILSPLGYDGVEVWGNHLPGKDRDSLNYLAETLTDAGLRVPMISPYFDITGDPESQRQSVVDTKAFCRACEILRAPLLRVFTGVSGSEEATAAQYSAAVRVLREMAAIAAASGVSLALETHPSTLVDSIPAVHRLLDAVDHPAVKINLDIYHMWEVHHDPVWAYEQLRGSVAHVHAKNANLGPVGPEHYPLLHDKHASQQIVGVTYLDNGDMAYQPFLRALQESGYDGFVSVEWFGPNAEAAAEHELAYLNDQVSWLKVQPST